MVPLCSPLRVRETGRHALVSLCLTELSAWLQIRAGGGWRFPRQPSGTKSACQCRRHQRPGFDPWVRKMPWRRAWQCAPGFWPGEHHKQRTLAGCSPRGSQRVRHDSLMEQRVPLRASPVTRWYRFVLPMQETWVRSQGREDPREEEIATHCCVVAWEIPRTQEPGGLRSRGSHRVRYDLMTQQQNQPVQKALTGNAENLKQTGNRDTLHFFG